MAFCANRPEFPRYSGPFDQSADLQAGLRQSRWPFTLNDMGRAPRIPNELRRRPFTLAEARAAGLSRKHLAGKSWKRLGRALYCSTTWQHDHWQLISGWKRLLPDQTIFAGKTAAWLWGLDANPTDPVEVIVPGPSGVRSRLGLSVRHNAVAPAECVVVRRVRVTTLNRTLCDLCAHLAPVEALCLIDMALTARRTDLASLIEYADGVRGRTGALRLRQLAQIAAPAESPMETRLRWMLLKAGLPQPEVQTSLHDHAGRFIGRADLCYPEARLMIEYDGANHRDRLVQDNRRQNLLVNAGFRLLRFTASDLDRPAVVVTQVQCALASHRPPPARRPG